MKKIILVSIIALNLSALAQTEMPAATEATDMPGTIQKTDPSVEQKIKEDFKSNETKKLHGKKHKKSHGKKHKKLTQ